MPKELDAALEFASQWWPSVPVPDDANEVWPTLYSELGERFLDVHKPFQIDRDPFMVAFFEAAAETYREILLAEQALD